MLSMVLVPSSLITLSTCFSSTSSLYSSPPLSLPSLWPHSCCAMSDAPIVRPPSSPLLFVPCLLPHLPSYLCMHRNSATDAVQQELLFVGQEAGKLIAMRNIIKKVHTWFPATAVYTYSTSLTLCTMFLQLHPSISPFASGDTLFLSCAHAHARMQCTHTKHSPNTTR